jgi:hypothetical protein
VVTEVFWREFAATESQRHYIHRFMRAR